MGTTKSIGQFADGFGESPETNDAVQVRPVLSRWFHPLLAVLAGGVTLGFVAFDPDDAVLGALVEGGFALVLAGGLFVVSYRYFTTTNLPETGARTVALGTVAEVGLLAAMNVWFRFLEANREGGKYSSTTWRSSKG